MALENLNVDFAILGQALQGVALGFAAQEERTLDFVAQTVEVMFLVALVVVGTLVLVGSRSPDDDSSVWNGQTLFVLLVRADVTGQLAVAVVRTLTWFWKLRPTKMPYTHDIFPLQVVWFALLAWYMVLSITPHSVKTSRYGLCVNHKLHLPSSPPLL